MLSGRRQTVKNHSKTSWSGKCKEQVTRSTVRVYRKPSPQDPSLNTFSRDTIPLTLYYPAMLMSCWLSALLSSFYLPPCTEIRLKKKFKCFFWHRNRTLSFWWGGGLKVWKKPRSFIRCSEWPVFQGFFNLFHLPFHLQFFRSWDMHEKYKVKIMQSLLPSCQSYRPRLQQEVSRFDL